VPQTKKGENNKALHNEAEYPEQRLLELGLQSGHLLQVASAVRQHHVDRERSGSLAAPSKPTTVTSSHIWLEIALLLNFGSIALISPFNCYKPAFFWNSQCASPLPPTPKNPISHLGHSRRHQWGVVLMLPSALKVWQSHLFCCRLCVSVGVSKHAALTL